MKKIKKAIFPVGGMGTRFLPATKAMPKEMLPVIDKPLIQYAVEEALDAGIEELIFVTGRGKTAIEDHFDYTGELEFLLKSRGREDLLNQVDKMVLEAGKVSYVRQQKPLGLGHAVWCARHIIGDEPFAVLLADDLIVGANCLKELISCYDDCNVLAVQKIHDEDVNKYGIIDPIKTHDNVVLAKGVVEKPQLSNSPSNIAVIGRYVLQPDIFDILAKDECKSGGEIQLTNAINLMIPSTDLKGVFFSGERFDCGSKLGMVKSTIYSALNRSDLSEDVLEYIRGIK